MMSHTVVALVLFGVASVGAVGVVHKEWGLSFTRTSLNSSRSSDEFG